ncbi:MAG: hypothetical protein V3U59_01175, partial [Gammaproteobacteria bacterium]
YWIGFAHAWNKEFEQGYAAMHRAIELDPNDRYAPVGLAYLYALGGEGNRALEILDEGVDGFPVIETGLVYGELGDLDEAFAYINRAFEEEPISLFYLSADPAADPLRDDPRWEELLEKLAVGIELP